MVPAAPRICCDVIQSKQGWEISATHKIPKRSEETKYPQGIA